MIKGLYEAHLPVSDMERSIAFYQKLGLELAHRGKKLAFFWIEKGTSWLGLWETKEVSIPYHPSIRHLAFQIDSSDMDHIKAWLKERGIEVREAFGFTPEEQPLVLANTPHAHAAVYFQDPDGNSLEMISPLAIDTNEHHDMMQLKEWKEKADR
ncbi:VOC family protein [Pseudalkalibacillus sp. SCS-8]|uniref:VOC family protein n=1 Tax=Pseudalkalibacillus nanhaiensis TaxID=3115291 RepID=UPI0032DB4EBC